MSASISSLESQLASITSVMATETRAATLSQEMITYSIINASINLISAKEVLSTATDTAAAAEVVSSASSVLYSLISSDNPYGMIPSEAGNVAMAVIMALLLAANAFLGVFYQTWWFGITSFIGICMETVGYVARSLSVHNLFSTGLYAMQMATLTFAPAFIMAGVYYILAQLVHIYGTQYALVQPKAYKRVFIGCDIFSFFVQAGGGAISSSSTKHAKLGSIIMIIGIAIQLVGMTGFLFLFSHYFIKIGYVSRHCELKERCGEFPPKYAHIRKRRGFGYYPLAIFISVVLVYIRSLYRIVELAEGFKGYLMTHEQYTMIFDAALMTLAILILTIFHPGFMMGKGDPVKNGSKYDDVEMTFGSDKSEFGAGSTYRATL